VPDLLALPNDTEHHAIYGMNGSGKTVFALDQLSRRSYDRMPWVIIDAKRDPTIAQIPRIEEIGIDDKPPRRKGLYVVRPMPQDFDDRIVTEWLFKVWQQENTGLMLDEGYMFNARDPGLRAVLTQGRSKHIPVIALSQRPSWISPFIHSESVYKSVFYLQMPQDIDKVQEWLPACAPQELPPHHSYWYAVKTRDFRLLGPCQDENAILDRFDARRVRKWFL
jgi:DNA helicase HerA-like ATPase